MNVLFVHHRGPGQFGAWAAHLAALGDRVALIGGTADAALPRFWHHPTAGAAIGDGVAAGLRRLARDGVAPDVVVAHPGWDGALALPHLLPRVPLLAYCEFFYHPHGTDLGFVPETAPTAADLAAIPARNLPLLAALGAARAGLAPTAWQRDLHPPAARPRIVVVHDGVDTEAIRPDPAARFRLPDGRVLSAGEEIVTFVARDLEPHRGFPVLMRALPRLLASRPRARIVICGGDGVAYGRRPPGGGTWRATLLAEVGPLPPRVHFVGWLPRARYLALLRVSALHLYLSVPFVLSWSLIEAMASGCAILAGDTAPVRDAITPGITGVLVDPRDPVAVAEGAARLLRDRQALGPMRQRARSDAVARFSLARCLPARTRLLRAIA